MKAVGQVVVAVVSLAALVYGMAFIGIAFEGTHERGLPPSCQTAQ